MLGILKLKYKQDLRECAALMLKKRKHGERSREGGEFIAVFNFVLGLLSWRRSIRLSLMPLKARDQMEIGCKTTEKNIFKQAKLFQDGKSCKRSESFVNKNNQV